MKLSYSQQFDMAFHSLRPNDIKAVTNKLNKLAAQNTPPFSGLVINKIPFLNPTTFSLHATKELRLIFQYKGDNSLYIIDIMPHERMKNLLTSLGNRGEAM